MATFEKLTSHFWILALQVCQEIFLYAQSKRHGDGAKYLQDSLGINLVVSGRSNSVLHILGKGWHKDDFGGVFVGWAECWGSGKIAICTILQIIIVFPA